MKKGPDTVRVVFETTAAIQHGLRQLAAKKNRKIRDVLEEMIKAELKAENIEIIEGKEK